MIIKSGGPSYLCETRVLRILDPIIFDVTTFCGRLGDAAGNTPHRKPGPNVSSATMNYSNGKEGIHCRKNSNKNGVFVLQLTELYLFLQISPVFMASLGIFSLLFFFYGTNSGDYQKDHRQCTKLSLSNIKVVK